MSIGKKLLHILTELKSHAPFTAMGAVFGILFMAFFKNLTPVGSHRLFIIFHPGHVILSALVTASMFHLHSVKKRLILVLLIGYFGSIGIATLSDIIIPEIGTRLLGLDIPSHAELHRHSHQEHNADSETFDNSDHAGEHSAAENHTEHSTEQQKRKIHLGFIDDWYIVNPAALLGAFIAFFIPNTKFPHALHVLIGTWASSSYLLMNMVSEMTIPVIIGIFATLFLATWLPCCISDIVFPLLFVKEPLHSHHHH